MRKIISLTTVLLICMMCFVGCTKNYNTSDDGKPYDSLNMPIDQLENIRDKYTDKSSQTVIKFYMGTHLFKFEFGEGIKEIWKTPTGFPFPSCYVVVDGANEIRKTVAGGEEWYTSYDELFLYALNTDKVFDKDVEVQNIYCFAEITASVCASAPEETTPYSTALFDPAMPFVYYVTSKGDFVLCRLEDNGDTYLLPLNKFKEYVHAIYIEDGVEQRAAEYDEKYGDTVLYGGIGKYAFTKLMPTKETFDLTSYIFTERT